MACGIENNFTYRSWLFPDGVAIDSICPSTPTNTEIDKKTFCDGCGAPGTENKKCEYCGGVNHGHSKNKSGRNNEKIWQS